MQVQEAELREGFKVEKKGFTLGKGVVYGGVFLKCVKWSNSKCKEHSILFFPL